ncbi:hypothetical protein M2169_002442 [Streptomyces sp. MJP52]|nr:hypothetical protein [Streptomyces sp. MJP52]
MGGAARRGVRGRTSPVLRSRVQLQGRVRSRLQGRVRIQVRVRSRLVAGRLGGVQRRGLRRHRVVAAEGVLGGAGGQAGEDDAAVVADQDGARGDVPVHPAVRVQHPERHQQVRGDLGGPVRRQRPLGEHVAERTAGHRLGDHPEGPAVGEHVVDLVETWVVGDPRRLPGGLEGPPHRRLGGLAAPAAAVPGGRAEAFGQPVGVEHLGLDDLGQRDLTDPHLLPAVRVEGEALRQVVAVLAGGVHGQAIAIGEYPSRVVVHHTLPAPPGRSNPFGVRRVPAALPSVYGPRGFTIRAVADTRRSDATSCHRASRPDQDFGRNVVVRASQVFSRRSPFQSAAGAVYIRA